LRPGMTATATITTRAFEDALLVKLGALRFKPPKKEPPRRGFLPFMRSSGPRPEGSGDRPAPNAAKGTEQVFVLEGGAPKAVPVRVQGTDGIQAAIEVVASDSPLQEGSEALLQVKAPPEP